MADQIEIMSPAGRVSFVDLDPVKGFTNIGRHPDNDIVVDDASVAPFHAVIDHREKPYHVTVLAEGYTLVGGQPVSQNASRPLAHLDSIELNGHVLLLVEAGAASPDVQARRVLAAPPPVYVPPAAPARPGPAPAEAAASMEAIDAALAALDQFEALPPDQSDEFILTEYRAGAFAMDPEGAALDFAADVEQAASFQVNVVNGGPIVATFRVEIKGLDPAWVAVSPDEVNLNEGQRATFNVTLSAPRLPTSRAGPHYFSVVTTSPDHPGRMCCTTGVFAVNPYYEFAVGELSPRQAKIPYSRRNRVVAVPISNLGNGDAPFRVDAEDNEHGLDFEFLLPGETAGQAKHVDVTVPVDSTLPLSLRITPRKRRLIGIGGHNYSYTVTTALTASAETPRSVVGQARSTPLIGPWVLVLLLLILLGSSVAVFRPTIKTFQVNGGDRVEIAAGESATLSWDASRFARLTIAASENQAPVTALGPRPARPAAFVDQQIVGPEGGELPGGPGSIEVTPTVDTTYTLKAENILSRVIPRWFTPTSDVFVRVNPLLPSIKFYTDKQSVELGQPVVVSWEVDRADRVLLERNGAPETILPGEFIASREFDVDRPTTFTLTAFNAYTPPDGRTMSLTIQVTVPEATPLPLPVIQRFDVTPLEITQGDLVTISWEVSGTDTVTIAGIGELPPSGSRTARPDLTTVYVLTASNGQETVTSREVQVTVNPPPTPTPVPGAPQIEYFLASPEELSIGTGETSSVLLSWSVVGDTTDVQISGPNFGQATGLPAQGSLTVNTSEPTLFILTAFNGDLTTSQTAQVKVLNPVPKIDSISPSSSTDVGGPGLTVVVKGSGFVEESKVRWEGSDRATAFISANELHATITADDLLTAGAFNLTVFNAVPGGGTSNSVVFNLTNPTPNLLGISPTSVTKGSGTITLTVSGSNFIKGSTIRFGGVDMDTTFINSAQLTAQVPSSQLEADGQRDVSVFNPSPGGGSSNSIPFTINATNPAPVINSLAQVPPGLDPGQWTAGKPALTFEINGSGFVFDSLVFWDTTPVTATYQSDLKLLVEDVPQNLMDEVGTGIITVQNPPTCAGSCTSNDATFTLVAPEISLSGSDTTLVRQSQSWTVTLDPALEITTTIRLTSAATGIATVSAETVDIVPPATTATFNVTGVALGVTTIRAQLPDELGGGSVEAEVTVGLPAPVISTTGGLSITSKPVGSASFDLTITGEYFQNGPSGSTAAQWFNPSTGITTTLAATTITVSDVVSDTLVVNVLQNLLQTPTISPIQVSVVNPGPCSPQCESNTRPFSVNSPTITSIDPTTKIAGGLGFTLVVTGTNFIPATSVVTWAPDFTFQQADLVPQPGSTSTRLIVQVPPNYIVPPDLSTYPGTVQVGVVNSAPCLSGCASNATSFAVTQPVITLSPDTLSVSTGFTSTMTVTVDVVPNGNLVVDLSSSEPLTATVPAQVTILGGSTQAQFEVSGEGPGSAIITATLSDFGDPDPAAQSTVNVSAAAATVTLAKISPDGNPPTGTAVTFRATVPQVGRIVPTGSVTFTATNGATTTLCSLVPVTLTTAECETSALVASQSPYIITAEFFPDNPIFTGDTDTLNLTVLKGDTQIDLDRAAVPPLTDPVTGETVIFTAPVTVVSGVGTPTGTITYTNGSTNITGCAGLALGATCTTTLRASGSPHSLTATYSGDANFNGDTSDPPLTQTVLPASTTAILQGSDLDSVFGQTVWFTATVSITAPGGGTLGGNVVFKDGTTTLATVPISGPSGTSVSTSTSSLSVATHTITAQYDDTSGDYNDSNIPSVTQTVIKASTTAILQGSDLDAVFGQTLWFTTTVNITAPGGGTLGGNVVFKDGAATLATVPISGPSGTSVSTSTSSLSVASHTITAQYVDTSGNYNDSNTDTVTQVVNKASTTAILQGSDLDAVFGQTLWFTTTVSITAPGGGTLGGNVVFTDTVNSTSTVLGTVPISGASGTSVSLSSSSLVTGTHTITAQYVDTTGNYNNSNVPSLNQVVNKANTTADIESSDPDAVFGQSLWFTATVSIDTPGGGLLNGTVTFWDGSPANVIGTRTITNGASPVSVSIGPISDRAVATHTIRAQFTDTGGNHNDSNVASVTQVVSKAATTLTITSDAPDPSGVGAAISVQMTLSIDAPGAGTPTGSITVSLSSDTATCSVPTVSGAGNYSCNLVPTSTGNKTITATYNGNGNFFGDSDTEGHQVTGVTP